MAMASYTKAGPASVARTTAISPLSATTFLPTSGQPLQRNRAWTLILAKFGLCALAKFFGLPTTSFIPSQVSGIPPPHSFGKAGPRIRQREKRTSQKDSHCMRTTQNDDSNSADDETKSSRSPAISAHLIINVVLHRRTSSSSSFLVVVFPTCLCTPRVDYDPSHSCLASAVGC